MPVDLKLQDFRRKNLITLTPDLSACFEELIRKGVQHICVYLDRLHRDALAVDQSGRVGAEQKHVAGTDAATQQGQSVTG